MKAIKWGAIGVGVLIALFVAALLISSPVFDVQKFKPEIEKKVTEATGRPVHLGRRSQPFSIPVGGPVVFRSPFGNPRDSQKGHAGLEIL